MRDELIPGGGPKECDGEEEKEGIQALRNLWDASYQDGRQQLDAPQ
jgi:hypothetical protein